MSVMVDLSTAECNGKKNSRLFFPREYGPFPVPPTFIPTSSHSHFAVLFPFPWDSHSPLGISFQRSSLLVRIVVLTDQCRVGIIRRPSVLCGRVCAQIDMPSSKSASVCAQSKRQGRAIHTDLSGNARPTSGVAVGATPAEKSEGTCGGVDHVRFPPASLPRLPISLHPCFAQFLSFPFKFS